eukprot:s3206_g3.t1
MRRFLCSGETQQPRGKRIPRFWKTAELIASFPRAEALPDAEFLWTLGPLEFPGSRGITLCKTLSAGKRFASSGEPITSKSSRVSFPILGLLGHCLVGLAPRD